MQGTGRRGSEAGDNHASTKVGANTRNVQYGLFLLFARQTACRQRIRELDSFDRKTLTISKKCGI
jgi:hypothetical protein